MVSDSCGSLRVRCSSEGYIPVRVNSRDRRTQGMISNGWSSWEQGKAIVVTSVDLRKEALGARTAAETAKI